MKILVYEHRKNDGEYFNISTPEKERAVYLLLFKSFDEESQAYCDLEDVKEQIEHEPCEPCQKNLHRLCESTVDSPCGCTAGSECAKRVAASRGASADELRQKKLYDAAKAGDADAAKKLLKLRSDRGYEYEEFRIVSVTDPVEELEKLKAKPKKTK
jgi:hypothetical protein